MYSYCFLFYLLYVFMLTDGEDLQADHEPMDVDQETPQETRPRNPPDHGAGPAPHRPPRCNNEGCHRDVFVDPRLPEGLPQFEYCSPECRNRSLAGVKEQLKKEIREMEEKLKSTKTSLTLFGDSKNKKSKATEYSSNPITHTQGKWT